VKIRSLLLLFAAFSVLPVLVFSFLITVVFWRQQRAAFEDQFLDRVRGMAIALDREHNGMIQVLRSVASSSALDEGDLVEFRRQARRVLGEQRSWTSLVLIDANKKALIDLRLSAGEPLPSLAALPFVDSALADHHPVVSDLVRDPLNGEYVTYVGVPVMRGLEARYALFAVVPLPTWLALIGAYPVAPDATMTLLGSDYVIIARTLNNERWVGKVPSPGLLRNAREAPEGAYRNVGLEGQWFYSAHSRARLSGWTIATGVPPSHVEGALRLSTTGVFLGAALAMSLAAVFAIGFGQRIARPVAALGDYAAGLGQGQPPAAPPILSRIEEMDAVAAALQQAGATIEAREAERDALLGREQAARAAAEEASRAKDEFLAVLSHELRTPLNAVYGWAHLLKEDSLDAAGKTRALDAIVRNANAQVQLIDDLLDVSRIVSGKMRLDVRQVDLRAVAEAALDAVRPAADAKGLRLESVLDPRAGPVMGDHGRLQQVVWNLLMNSVKFTPKGGRIQLHVYRALSHAEIAVSDTGQGIESAVLPHVFERFTQGDSSSTRSHGGLGLGLALARHIVELHGGTVAAESAGVGRGARFLVRLPVALAHVEEGVTARGALPSAEATAAPAIARVRVLVVDDDRDAVDLAATILTGAAADVRTARSAEEALRVMTEWHPQVLVCDIEMPGEDGYSLIREVRAVDAAGGGYTPAVALTAYSRVEDRIRSLGAGFTMHLPKPVDPAELVAVVASLA
jgi:signal transduction histidine kinase